MHVSVLKKRLFTPSLIFLGSPLAKLKIMNCVRVRGTYEELVALVKASMVTQTLAFGEHIIDPTPTSSIASPPLPGNRF